MNERERQERRQRVTLTFLFGAVFFLILLMAVFFGGSIVRVILRQELYRLPDPMMGYRLITWMILVSAALGALLVGGLGRFLIQPVNTLIVAMNRLAAGHFETRIRVGSLLSHVTLVEELADSFNTMAGELESTEMLRSDFVNNFSHEFKTPIVSIAGFASLLRRGDLNEQEQREYLSVIETESLRLAAMATNILNLTKIENQSILTDVTAFNLSEQIRSCILQLEQKWSEKNLEIEPEFAEFSIEANEELLRHVWLNLLDNAVKFSPEGGVVALSIGADEKNLHIRISNQGPTIPAEKLEHIWGKFYQADESHAGQGNGIGLAIVRSVVKLHGGSAAVRSEDGHTEFTVTLPKNRDKR